MHSCRRLDWEPKGGSRTVQGMYRKQASERDSRQNCGPNVDMISHEVTEIKTNQ